MQPSASRQVCQGTTDVARLSTNSGARTTKDAAALRALCQRVRLASGYTSWQDYCKDCVL